MVFAFFVPLLAIGPGHHIARMLRLRPLDHFIAAILLGLFIQAAAVFTLFALHFPPASYVAVSAASLALLAVSWRSLTSLARSRPVFYAVAAYGLVALASVVLVLPLRNFSGGTWVIDWHVHFSQSCYYLGYTGPVNYLADFPSRPPMQNLLTAFAMAHAGTLAGFGTAQPSGEFATFQLTSVILASVAFLPCFAVARRLGLRRFYTRRLAWVLVAMFLISPAIVAHLLFPWPKLLPAAYVVFALYLYQRHLAQQPGVRNAPAYFLATVLFLAMGSLIHYSCAVYGVVLLAHIFWRWVHRQARVSEMVVAVGVPALLLAPWLVWAVTQFGVETTLTSPGPINESRGMTLAQYTRKTWTNYVHTFLPHLLVVPSAVFENGIQGAAGLDAIGFAQPSTLGYVRDYTFSIFTSTLPLSLGLGGLVVCAGLAFSGFKESLKREARVWMFFVVGGTFLGIAVNGGTHIYGVAQVALVPLTLLGTAFVAANLGRVWGLATGWRWMALAGAAVDVALGVVPHLVASSRIFNLEDVTNRVLVDAETISRRAAGQFQLKESLHILTVGDLLASAGGAVATEWALRCAVCVPIVCLGWVAFGTGRPQSTVVGRG